ncbi:hypothetical protein BH10PSE7_BH10PSE7_25730 [soil metagenome]
MTPLQKEVQVTAIIRFGNYFFIAGSQSLGPGNSCEFEIRFGSFRSRPEFVFLQSASRDVEPPEGTLRQSATRTGFCLCIWINDGYKVQVNAESPAVIQVVRQDGVQAQGDGSKIVVDDFAAVISIAKACSDPAIWTNRFTVEVFTKAPSDVRHAFLRAAIHFISAPEAQTLVTTLFGKGESGFIPTAIADLWEAVVAQSDPRYLEPEIRQAFVDASKDLKIDLIPERRVADILRGLVKVGALPEAYGLLGRAIRFSGTDRHRLATILQPVLPVGTQWWLKAALESNIGGDQVADALITVGAAFRNDRRHTLARHFFDAAHTVYPQNQSSAINGGWSCLEEGDPLAAIGYFTWITRHYPNNTLATFWPDISGSPWPASPLSRDMFEALNPGAAWPRITIVTPSFMHGKFIEETILSVLNQGYPNLQYIIVDGASNDETREVLEKYRDRIDVLVIEPDKGQSEAINKGFRHADGELVAWLNSDDMYAPGALHMVALAYLRKNCDVIAGICVEHADKRLLLLNKPAATAADFNVEKLSDIFKFWLKGHYFYQPEVFFTKAILDKAGPLDETLYYSMDYDLWMRFANLSARLEVISWPVALFRKHDAQKTNSLTECIEEQAIVRSRYNRPSLGANRRLEIEWRLRTLTGNPRPAIGVVSKRIHKIFSDGTGAELAQFASSRGNVFFGEDERDGDIREADFLIYLVHVQHDADSLKALRKARPDRAIAGWYWDNHHHLFENHTISELVDVVIPGHNIASEYLQNREARSDVFLPLCVTQWCRQDAARWFETHGAGDRLDPLYGGFVDYAFAPRRSRFLAQLRPLLPANTLSLMSERRLNAYFGRKEEERFAEWCRSKTSLVLPLRNDLSQRVFDALLTGQIPIVPTEIADLDRVISADLQERLPIIRFTMSDPESAVRAWQEAITRFDAGGAEATRARHIFALENHMFANRINTIIDRIYDSAPAS